MRFEWNPKKNKLLKKERKISFEQIVFHISQGDVWKKADHTNQQKYPGQKIYLVIVDGYVYIVPYVEDNDCIFLKTIIPSRKATRDYIKQKQNGDENETG